MKNGIEIKNYLIKKCVKRISENDEIFTGINFDKFRLSQTGMGGLYGMTRIATVEDCKKNGHGHPGRCENFIERWYSGCGNLSYKKIACFCEWMRNN